MVSAKAVTAETCCYNVCNKAEKSWALLNVSDVNRFRYVPKIPLQLKPMHGYSRSPHWIPGISVYRVAVWSVWVQLKMLRFGWRGFKIFNTYSKNCEGVRKVQVVKINWFKVATRWRQSQANGSWRRVVQRWLQSIYGLWTEEQESSGLYIFIWQLKQIYCPDQKFLFVLFYYVLKWKFVLSLLQGKVTLETFVQLFLN